MQPLKPLTLNESSLLGLFEFLVSPKTHSGYNFLTVHQYRFSMGNVAKLHVEGQKNVIS